MTTRHDVLRELVWDYDRKWRGAFMRRTGSLGNNSAGFQCTNVPNTFWELFGLPGVIGNAADWIGFSDEHRGYLPLRFDRRLTVGDVAIFNPELVGANGHVDLVLDGSRVPWRGLDQNWPLNAPCSEVWHTRGQVIGLIRLRSHVMIPRVM